MLFRSSFGREKERFKRYLLRKKTECFSFEGEPYEITISDVQLYPQGYAAVLANMELLKGEPSVVLADIGGWTLELMRLDNHIPNAATCRSLELGMIRCMDEVTEQVRRSAGLSLTAAQVEAVLKDEPVSYTHLDVYKRQEFEQAKTEKDKTIHILHFTDLSSIRPVYYDKTYHAIPEQGGEKAYELLRKAMKEENKIAIAKTVLSTKEKLLALIPTDDDIMVETMYFADEVKEAPKEIQQPEVSEQELNMAKMLIGSMEQEFNPAAYKDEYRQRLWEIINAKIQGKEIIAAPEEGQSNVINLMDALKASLEKQKQTPTKKPRSRKQAASE